MNFMSEINEDNHNHPREGGLEGPRGAEGERHHSQAEAIKGGEGWWEVDDDFPGVEISIAGCVEEMVRV